MIKKRDEKGRIVETDFRFDNVSGNIYSQGIYRILDKTSGKSYIGCCHSNKFKKRWQKHDQRLANDEHPCAELQDAYNQYGFDNFKFEIIQDLENDSREYKFELEALIIKYIPDEKLINTMHTDKGTRVSYEMCQEIIQHRLDNKDFKEISELTGTGVGNIKKICSGKHYHTDSINREVLSKLKEISANKIFEAAKKSNNANKTVTDIQAGQIKWLSSQRRSPSTLSEYFNIPIPTLEGILKGKTYKDCPPVECPKLLKPSGIQDLIDRDKELATFFGKIRWLLKSTNKYSKIVKHLGCHRSHVGNIKNAISNGKDTYDKYPEIPCPDILEKINNA